MSALRFTVMWRISPAYPDIVPPVLLKKVGSNVIGFQAGDRVALSWSIHSQYVIAHQKNVHKVHGPGISLIGAHTLARPEDVSSPGLWTTHDDVMAMQRLHQSGRLNLRKMIRETHIPSEAPQVYTRLANEKVFPVVQFDWRNFRT